MTHNKEKSINSCFHRIWKNTFDIIRCSKGTTITTIILRYHEHVNSYNGKMMKNDMDTYLSAPKLEINWFKNFVKCMNLIPKSKNQNILLQLLLLQKLWYIYFSILIFLYWCLPSSPIFLLPNIKNWKSNSMSIFCTTLNQWLFFLHAKIRLTNYGNCNF